MTREEIKTFIDSMLQKDELVKRLSMNGLIVPTKPENAKKLEGEWNRIKESYGGISDVPYNVLGDYLDKWVGLVSYTRWLEALADVSLTTAKEIRDSIREKLFVLKEGSRELRKALVYSDELYVDSEKKYLDKLSYFVSIKALREGYEQRLNAISREITRRGFDNKDVMKMTNRGGANGR